jgi:GNAT superfamily N-acetyltransferase
VSASELRSTPEAWARRGCAIVVAAVAAYASYEHQRAFALRGGTDPTGASLWPLSVDGLLVLATIGLLKPAVGGSRRAYSELNPDDEPLAADAARDIWAAVRRQQGRTVLVAALDDTLAGTADCTVLPNLTRTGRPIMFVENVVVAQAHRRRGIGKLLMDAAGQLAESTNCYKIQLLAADGHEAHIFYQACGYQPLAQGFRRYLDQLSTR